MFDDWGDASLDPQVGDLVSYTYLRQTRTGVVKARNGERICVEAESGSVVTGSKWVDLEDVTSIDATASSLAEANRATEAARRQVEYLKLAARVHEAAASPKEKRGQEEAALHLAATQKKAAEEERDKKAAAAVAAKEEEEEDRAAETQRTIKLTKESPQQKVSERSAEVHLCVPCYYRAPSFLCA